jgi:hypothetical protein
MPDAACLRERNTRELALPDLKNNRCSGLEHQSPIAHFLAIKPHATLLNHAQGLRSAAGQPGLLEHLRNPHPCSVAGDPHTLDILRNRPLPEACLEIRQGTLGGLARVEALDDLQSEQDLHIARIAPSGDLA